MFGFSKAVGN